MPDGPGRPAAKYRQIADHFRGLIESGELGPDDLLPSQAAIQDEFRASMGTVVRALEALRREGLVRTEHGKGTYVEPPPKPSGEFLAVMKRLDEMEAEVRRLAAKIDGPQAG